MKPHTRNKKKPSLVGVWRSADEFTSNVEYRVRKKGTGYSATAKDVEDGEEADVFEEKWDARTGIFSFATHWNSTGRFLRCRLQLISEEKVELTYTYTDSETLLRHKRD